MPSATLRKPDYTEIPPAKAVSRGVRLRIFVQQDLAGSVGERVNLIAWCAKTKCWGAWFDSPAPPAPNAKIDALVEADVAIGD